MRGPDRWSISLGRGCRDQENSRIPMASQRRSLLAPESPSEGESPPPRTQLQKSHTESEEVSRGTEQGLGTGLVATQLLRGGSLQSHVLCRCPGGRCSPHVFSSSIHWEFPFVNLILLFCVFLSTCTDFSFFFFFFPLFLFSYTIFFFFSSSKTYPVII